MDKQHAGLGRPETAPAQASDFQELSPLLLTAVDVTVSDINDQLMITSSTTVQIDPTLQAHRKRFPKELDELEYRRDALAFLHRLGGVGHCEVPGCSILPPERWEKAKVQVNLARFRQIKYELSRVLNSGAKPETVTSGTARRQDKQAGEPPQERSPEAVYEVKYTQAREILINGFLLAKLDFNSENDNVFDYLYKNPSRTITITELEKRLGETPLKESPHKIVENLGFTQELKKAFFDISKDSIRFRNRITRSQLQELGIAWLRFPRR